jgi:UDP-2-acetamido-3-amino-2,3-dideoxy-glucuronate N-acetyltransferase
MSTDPQIHETAAVDDGCRIGQGTKVWHFAHILSGSVIGENVSIGQNVAIGPKVSVGNGCKIQNNVSVYEGVTLEDDVFCGPSCVFTNVHTPRAFINRKNEFGEIVVRRGATIGANATVICGRPQGRTELGAYCFIAAGAVVTKDVPPYALMVGTPARRVGWVSRAGEVLGADLICPRTGERYEEDGGKLQPVEKAD